MEETIEVVKFGPQEQVQFRTAEQNVAAFVPQIFEELVEVIWFIPQERISERIVDQIVDVSVPQIRQRCVEVAKDIPHERLQQHTVEQIFDVLVPQNREEIGRRSSSFRKNEFLRSSLKSACTRAQWIRSDMCTFLRVWTESWKVFKPFRGSVFWSESSNMWLMCQCHGYRNTSSQWHRLFLEQGWSNGQQSKLATIAFHT